MSTEEIIDIPEADEPPMITEDEKDFCLNCGLLRLVNMENGLCDDCIYKEREEW